MKKINVIVNKPDIIPNVSKWYASYNISDRYYGIAYNLHRDIVKVLCYFDFKSNKWCFDRSGIIELIEYYELSNYDG